MNNSLFAVDASWIHDGSQDSTLVSSSPSALQASSNQKGTPLNIMLQPSTTIPTNQGAYYEIHIKELNGTLAIGVVRSSEFHPGFKTRGMFYNGGLTNGMVRLLVGFSNRPAVGDTVGVCVFRKDSNLLVAYYLNGRCLGTGFQLQQQEETDDEAFLPCLQVDGTVECEVVLPESLPSIMTRQEEVRTNPHLGDWLLVEASRMRAFGGKEFVKFSLPKDQEVLVKLVQGATRDNDKEQAHYELELKIVNTFRTKLTVIGITDDSNEKLEVGHVTSTMMMPPLSLVSVENYIEKSLNGLYQMRVTSNDRLVMTCHAAEWVCERHSRTFEPVKSYK